MSDQQNHVEVTLGFLLLRDGHAVPLAGVTPDDLKRGAKHLVPHPDAEPMRHRQTLNAIVDRLGFQGDFGDFVNRGWPALQAFLQAHGCTGRAGLFPSDHGGCIDLNLRPISGPTRRQLADRVFEAGGPPPNRVFLGHGVDWAAWDRGDGFNAPEDAIQTVGGDPTTARQRCQELFSRRHDLSGQWGFLDDKLLAGPVRHIVDKSYSPPGTHEQLRIDNLNRLIVAVHAFRAVFDCQPEGWVDVLRVNDRLVVLRAHDGAWDLLWRGYRATEPPKPEDFGRGRLLSIEDLPSSLMSEHDRGRAIHFRQEVWDEQESHDAEQAFYDRGGTMLERRMTAEADVRFAWLREQGRLSTTERTRRPGEVPPGFRLVNLAGARLLVSELVDLGAYRQMLVESGYDQRRNKRSEPWDRANEGSPDDAPVGATWADAQAFCAWKERKMGIPLRLPRMAELRALRPFFSERYASFANLDFFWENHPPRPLIERGADGLERRRDVPSAVRWSEPRFLEPGPDVPEFPPPGGWSGRSRRRWIQDFPPRAAWQAELPWAEHAGLRFIDAWDAYEWCQEEGQLSGRFWEGAIAANSWGAYKNVKVSFRLVCDLGV